MSRSGPVRLPEETAVDGMSGRQFEEFVARLLEKKGYRVQRKGGSGDFGADVICEAAQDRILVQAKKRTPPDTIGPSVIRDVVGGMSFHDCDQAMVVTNVDFSSAAEEQASCVPCELVGRENLKRWMEETSEVAA